MKDCRICKFFSRTLGRFLMRVLNRKWERITIGQVSGKKKNLDLEIVGGLRSRGWTVHDIDVVGDKEDAKVFAKRLRKARVDNPVHFCSISEENHSHALCLWNGLMLIVRGIGYY